MSEFSDWFSREEAPKQPVVLKPNPRNEDYDRKIEEMEERIKRFVSPPPPHFRYPQEKTNCGDVD